MKQHPAIETAQIADRLKEYLDRLNEVSRSFADGGSEGKAKWEMWKEKVTSFLQKNIPSEARKFASLQYTQIISDPFGNRRRKVSAHKSYLSVLIEELKNDPEYWNDKLNKTNSNVAQVVVLEKKKKSPAIGEKIFLVHGHDEKRKDELASFLTKLDLPYTILHQQADKGRTIIEKLEDHAVEVGSALVLLTADDLARAKDSISEKLNFRARQNVILELGFFIGKLGRSRVVVLHDNHPDFEMPSDYKGVLFIPLDENWKIKLIGELRAMNYSVDANKLF